MSTHLPGLQSFSRCLHYFVFTKLATTRIRANILSTTKATQKEHMYIFNLMNSFTSLSWNTTYCKLFSLNYY